MERPVVLLLRYWKVLAAAATILLAFGSAQAQLKQTSKDIDHLLVKEQKVDAVFIEIFERGVRVETIQANELRTLEQIQEDIHELRQEVRDFAQRNRGPQRREAHGTEY
jgi:hypothetical protein